MCFVVSYYDGYLVEALRHALTLTAIPAFFKRNSFRPTYFLPTAAKSTQKGPLEGNALHPTIRQI